MIKQGQIYRYNDGKDEYEIKIIIEDYVVYKELSGKISTYPIYNFIGMISSEFFILIKDVEINDCDTITVTKKDLRTFWNDGGDIYGSWSDTSYPLLEFIGIDPTVGI